MTHKTPSPPPTPDADTAVLDALSSEDRAALVDAVAARIPDALRAVKAQLLSDESKPAAADAA